MKYFRIGYDKKGKLLNIGDICKFEVEVNFRKKECEGIIIYDEETFSYAFEMKDDNFPIVLMNKVYMNSIKKIINVMETMDREYEFYKKIYENFQNSHPTS